MTLKRVGGEADLYDGFVLRTSKFGEFVGAQFGVITPILLVVMLIALWQTRLSDPGRLLFWFSIPILALFAAKSLQGRVQGHWALPAYLVGVIAMSIFVAQRWPSFSRGKRLTIEGGVALALAASIAIHFPARLRWPIKVDPMRRLTGWSELGSAVTEIGKALQAPWFVIAEDIHAVPELSFYVAGQSQAYCINLG